MNQPEFVRYGRYALWIRLLWELQFFFPKWRLPRTFPRAPIRQSTSSRSHIHLIFAGDLMVKSGDIPVQFDPALQQMMSTADMMFATLESPVVARGPDISVRYPQGVRMPPFQMPISFLEQQIANAGLTPQQTCLSVAANHAGDLGISGFETSCDLISNAGFHIVGRKEDDGQLLKIVEVGGMKLGLLAWTRWMNDEPFSFERPAVNRQLAVEAADLNALLRAADVDFALALPHWGLEMRAQPQANNRKLAETLVKQGFTLVVGSHPHMLQPLEVIDRGLCAYSLGNFTYTLSNICKYGRSWRSCLSGILQVGIDLDGNISEYKIIPIVEQYSENGCYVWSIDNYNGPYKNKYMKMIANLFSDSN